METEYQWSIESMQVDSSLKNNEDFVMHVEWSCTGSKNDETVKITGIVIFDHQENENFISYENLTPEIVLEWCFGMLDKSIIEGSVDQQLKQLINSSTKKKNLPWK